MDSWETKVVLLITSTRLSLSQEVACQSLKRSMFSFVMRYNTAFSSTREHMPETRYEIPFNRDLYTSKLSAVQSLCSLAMSFLKFPCRLMGVNDHLKAYLDLDGNVAARESRSLDGPFDRRDANACQL